MRIGTGFFGNITAILIVGLAVRLILAPFTTMPYDVSFHAGIINGINMGFGLYGSEYLWYSPVWGYVLYGLTPLINLLGINVQGEIIPDLVGNQSIYVYSAITDPAFNLIIKLPLIICDILIAIVLLHIVKKITQDEGKGVLAAGMWILCPLAIWNSSVQCQFDSLAILCMVGSILFLIDKRWMTAGAILSFGGIAKLFPVLIVPIAMGYLVATTRKDGRVLKSLGSMILGAVIVAVVIFLPVALQGDFSDSMRFLTDRVSSYNLGDYANMTNLLWGNILTLAPLIIACILIMSIFLAGSHKHLEYRLVLFSTLAFCLMFMWPNAPAYSQYMLYLIPFLALIHCIKGNLMVPYILASTIFTISVMALTGPDALLPFALSTGTISPDWLVSLSHSMDNLQDSLYRVMDFIKFIPALLTVVVIVWKYDGLRSVYNRVIGGDRDEPSI